MATRNNHSAFLPTHPGEILGLELDERGLTQKAMAEKIGMRPSHLSELINGKRSITISIADKLQEALGIDSQSWVNLQTQYNYDIRNSKQNIVSGDKVTLQIDLDDKSVLAEIKKAIGLFKGVRNVAIVQG